MKTKITKVCRSWCLLPVLLMSLMVQGRENSAIEIALGINDVTLISGVENFSISFEKERIWEVSPASISDLGGHEGDDNGPKITICHYPPGNPENVQTIEIAASAWPAHEDHGDSLDACSSDDDGNDDEEGGDDDNDDDDNSDKITICHSPPGNPENVQTIEIAASAWPAHEDHGDTQGACSNDDGDDDDDGDDENDDEEGCYAMEVIDYSPTVQSNGNAIAEDRTDATVALGEPDRANEAGGFASLGIGGQLTLRFSGAVYDTPGDDILIYETSFSGDNCSGANDERATVEVSQDGTNWHDAGEICRDGAIDLDGIPVVYVTQIRITDITTGNGDGYDVDGVEAVNGCQDVPSDGNDPCYGAFVVDNSYMPGLKKNGQPITDPERLDPSKALGVPQVDNTSNFVSLGYGGEITIGFDGLVLNQVGDDLVVVETTYGNATFASYPESADVYVSQDGFNFYFIGSVLTNESASLDISNASVALSYITQVRVVDTTPEGSVSPDGFDLDGIISLPGCTVLEDPNTCFSEIVNGGFEDDNTFAGSWKYVPQDEVPGWSTTSPTGTIEIQRSGMVDGNASNSGGFHFELNGDALNNIYQEICTTPGTNIEVSFSYMKRRNSGVDKMELYFSDAIETITDGTAYPFMATPGAGWETKSFVYAVPAGQESTIIFFKAVSGTSATIGNLLDDISVATTLASPTSLEELFAALSTKDQVLATTEVTMYPVPARDRLNVKLHSQLGGKVSYEIVSIMGQSLGRGSLDNYSGQGEIHADVSNLADGAYFLMIHLNGETISKKFIKATR